MSNQFLKEFIKDKRVGAMAPTPEVISDKIIKKRILDQSNALLNPNGYFITYQYSMLILPLMKRYFKDVQFTISLSNIPPVFIMSGESNMNSCTLLNRN